MSFWNLWNYNPWTFSGRSLATDDSYKVTLKRADKPESWSEMLGRMISYPFEVAHRLYNTRLLVKEREFREPASKNNSYSQWFTPFGTPFFTMWQTSIPCVGREILRYSRNSAEGLFTDNENKYLFLPVLRDLYPQEVIAANDFLMTCASNHVHSYRQPISHLIGASKSGEH